MHCYYFGKNTNGADIAIDDRRIGSTVTIRGVNIDFVGGKLSFTDGDSGEAADNFTYNFEEKSLFTVQSPAYMFWLPSMASPYFRSVPTP